MTQRYSWFLGLIRYGALSAVGKVFLFLFVFSHPVFAQSHHKILALGDSLTQGYGLNQGDGLVPQLQNWLNQNGVDAEIINAGVSGDTTAGGRDRVDWLMDDTIDTVIVALGGNDVLRGIPPSNSRENLDAILAILAPKNVRIVLVGMYAPMNYGSDYKDEFDAIFPDLAAKYGAVYIPSFFDPLFAASGQMGKLPLDLMQSDGIHPNAMGVQLIVDYIGPRILGMFLQK